MAAVRARRQLSRMKKFSSSVSDLFSASSSSGGKDFDKTSLNDYERDPILHEAASTGNLQTLALAIGCSNDMDIKDRHGSTALHRAVAERNLDAAEALAEGGANLNVKDHQGMTALHLAVRNQHIDMMRILLELGADTNVRDFDGISPLESACAHDNIKCARLLMQYGQSIRDVCASTIFAVREDRLPLLQFLLSVQVPLNERRYGTTPLHTAVTHKRWLMAAILCYFGADPSIRNSRGQSAIDLLRKDRSNNQDCKLLMQLFIDVKNSFYAFATTDYSSESFTDRLQFKDGDLILVTQHPENSQLWFGLSCTCDRTITLNSGRFPKATVHRTDTQTALKALPCRMYQPRVSSRAPPRPVGVPAVPELKASQLQIHHPQSAINRSHLSINSSNIMTSSQVSSSSLDTFKPHQKSCLNGQAANVVVNGNQQQTMSPRHRLSASSHTTTSSSGIESMQSTCPSTPMTPQVPSLTPRGAMTASSSGASSAGALDDATILDLANNAVDIRQLINSGITPSEQLSVFLTEIGLPELTGAFLDAGYDLATVTRCASEDLRALGVSAAQRQRLLQMARAHGPLDRWPRRVGQSSDAFREWMNSLGLHEHTDNLINQNITSVRHLYPLAWDDLADLGIDKLGHQKRILAAVRKLKEHNLKCAADSQSEPNSDVIVHMATKSTPNLCILSNTDQSARRLHTFTGGNSNSKLGPEVNNNGGQHTVAGRVTVEEPRPMASVRPQQRQFDEEYQHNMINQYEKNHTIDKNYSCDRQNSIDHDVIDQPISVEQHQLINNHSSIMNNNQQTSDDDCCHVTPMAAPACVQTIKQLRSLRSGQYLEPCMSTNQTLKPTSRCSTLERKRSGLEPYAAQAMATNGNSANADDLVKLTQELELIARS